MQIIVFTYLWLTKLFVATMLLCVVCACSKGEPGKVKVEGGWIQGTVTDGLAIYKGIPFATPPVGNLRWKAPQPVQKWEGVKDATKFGPGPMQNSLKILDKYFEWRRTPEGRAWAK